ncbi:MAG: hypothetical protein RL322_689 [Pseudomonadota bacterium]|jgi:cytoskeleton protein RodZ
MSQAQHQWEKQEPSVTADPTGIQSVDQLVRARESRGLAQSDLAARLGMTGRQIQAIERGDWRALPGRSFARTALRAYGRALSLNIEAILPAIDAEYGVVSEPINRPALDQPMPRRGVLGFSSSGPGNWLTWTILAVVGLIVMAFFFGGGASLLGISDAGGPADSSPTAAATPSSSGSASATAANPSGAAVPPPAIAAEPAPPVSAPSTTVSRGTTVEPVPLAGSVRSAAASGASSPAEPAGVPPSPAATGPSPAAAPGSATGAGLVLRFDAQAWIEIRDAGDRIVATGTQAAGATRVFDLDPPVSAVIGNPGAVSATWRGAPYDLKPHIRQGVARFRIEGSGR